MKGVQVAEKNLVDPLADALAHLDLLVKRRSRKSGDNHANGRRARLWREPSSLKEFKDLARILLDHPLCWLPDQHRLDLGRVEQVISFPTRHEKHARLDDFSDHSRVAVESVETYQSHLRFKSEAFQVSRDRLPCKREFAPIVAIASISTGAHPLPGMDLEHSRTCVHNLPTLASRISRHADRIESAPGFGQFGANARDATAERITLALLRDLSTPGNIPRTGHSLTHSQPVESHSFPQTKQLVSQWKGVEEGFQTSVLGQSHP